MDNDFIKGQRLFVETLDGTFEGNFHSIDPGHNKLTLKRVVMHPLEKQFNGLYHFYRNEVLNVRVLEPGSYPGVNKDSESAGEWNLMRKAETLHSNKAIGKITDSDVVMNLMPGHGSNKQITDGKNRNFTVEKYDELIKAARNSVMIDRIGDVFNRAIADIKKESTVGLHVEGARFGRRSKINLLTVATPHRVFIFDVLKLGDSAFSNGLSVLLETDKIKKVIHNCRMTSDCLYHRHNITLHGVFDTQVADLTVVKQRYGEYPRCVRSLSECLSTYLHLPEDIIPKLQVRAGYIAMDAAKWLKRPLFIEHQAIVSKSSVFLIELHRKLYEELMKPFLEAVNVFCSVVRDAEQMEASEHEAKDNLVPKELLSL